MGEFAKLLAASEVAEILGVPVATLYQWRHKGTGPRAMQIGRHLRYDAEDLRQWLESRKLPRASAGTR